MKRNFISIETLVMVAFVTIFTLSAHAQAPNWAVNANDFQFQMTITGSALVDCAEVTDPNDIVAAFANGECRGVVDFDVSVDNQQFAYLVLYSNMAQSEPITFQLYDASENQIYDLVNYVIFEENEALGDVEAPFVFSNNHPPTALLFDQWLVTDVSSVGDTVGQLLVEDMDNDEYFYNLPVDSLDNPFFQVNGDYIVFAASPDFATQSSFIFWVDANDANGCGISNSFEFTLQNTNEPPTDILFVNDDNQINENEPIGSQIGILVAADVSVTDQHIFELVPNSLDNDLFAISDSNLISDAVFDYEMQETYQILVRVTDAAGSTFEKELTVAIADVLEAEDLKANNVITPNGDGFNDAFRVPNIHLFESFEFQVFNENGNEVFRRSPSAGYNNLWDGKTTSGNELPSGVYYYVLKDANSDLQFVGAINLLKN